MQAFAVRRVPSSADLLEPGDFTFLQKRDPIRRVERTPLTPPAGRFKKLWWDLFGKKYELKQVIELLWPEHDVVILNCPHCNQPLATTPKHQIVSLEPLTIETPIACAYSQTKDGAVAFSVKEGQIIPT